MCVPQTLCVHRWPVLGVELVHTKDEADNRGADAVDRSKAALDVRSVVARAERLVVFSSTGSMVDIRVSCYGKGEEGLGMTTETIG